MADYLTQNTRTRKKDIIEQFGFIKDKEHDGWYRMKLKGIFENPQDYLDITLNLPKERMVIWAMPYRERVGCNSTLDLEGMLSQDPEWLKRFFNERIQWAVESVHIYIYKDMPDPLDEDDEE